MTELCMSLRISNASKHETIWCKFQQEDSKSSQTISWVCPYHSSLTYSNNNEHWGQGQLLLLPTTRLCSAPERHTTRQTLQSAGFGSWLISPQQRSESPSYLK
jgi:hypothetical protein